VWSGGPAVGDERVLLALGSRFGALADRIGSRVLIGLGALVGRVGNMCGMSEVALPIAHVPGDPVLRAVDWRRPPALVTSPP
jgi:hypothetical protein